MPRDRTATGLLTALVAGALLVAGAPTNNDAPLLAADAAPSAPAETGPKPKPITPPTPEAIDQAIERGVQFLLKDQNPDGSWGTAERTKGLDIYAPVPGAHHAFRAAVTALCISALIELDDSSERVQAAIDHGESWLFDHLPAVRRAESVAIYNVWTHIYGISALVKMLGRHPDDAERAERIKELIRQQFEMLQRYESVDGGWGYYDFRVGSKRPAADSLSFTSAAGLVALYEAKEAGIEPPKELVDRAIASILRQRKSDFTYLYGEYMKWRPMYSINRPGGSLGRSQACNFALRLWGRSEVTEEVLKTWLDRLFARNLWLDIGRKRPIPHESWFAVAGYFFYFGHYYAARCIEELPPQDRPHFQHHLAAILLRVQDGDGSWWDFPLYNYHQQYGTAFGLMTLKRCRKSPAAPPEKLAAPASSPASSN